MDFASGAMVTITTSFDVWAAQHPVLEVYGSEGTLDCPDPNGTGGPVRLWREGEWRELPLSHPYEALSRSTGVADMAYALRSGRPHRASGELAFHVLDMMHAFHDASSEGRHIMLESTCARPAPIRPDLPEGVLDL
jgi:predicted dehydrogenase